MFTFLKRVDPEENMDRWYMVFVQASLLDPVAVICAWGNRRNSYQQLRVLPAASWEEAHETAQDMVKKKVARGYDIVREVEGEDYIRSSSRRISRRVSTNLPAVAIVGPDCAATNPVPAMVAT
jgi:predicted DNA-binding WGR domain protein